MKKLLSLIILLIGAGVGFLGYKKYNAKFGDHRKVLDYPDGLKGTEGMLALIEIKRVDFQHPDNFYANSVKFDHFSSKEMPEEPDKRFKWEFQRAEQALNSGQNDVAVSLSEQAVAAMDEADYQGKWRIPLLEMQAISYIRKAELDNCLNNHNSESCIIPFTENAVHLEREGSTKASEVYRRILEEKPDHHHAKYMLNIAHVTLGDYPEAVPEQWRVAPSKLQASDELPRFKNVAEGLGVNSFSTSGSANIEDFNGDGYLDIFTSGFSLTEQAQLFIADGKGGYTETTVPAGLEGLPGGLNTTHCDYDNDGDRDIFILRGGWWNKFGDQPNSLLRNDGKGNFVDVTREAGLLSFWPTQSATWNDYDLDGDLDLAIGNEASKLARHSPIQLYWNNGDGTFTEGGKAAGLTGQGYIKGITSGDYNGDNYPDIFLSVYHGDNLLYANNGDGTFRDATAEAGVAKPWDSFPTWFFDYNNDGLLDLCVLTFSINMDNDIAAEYVGEEYSFEPPRIYRNNGDGTFADATEELGMNTMLMSMGSNYGDLNNDGWKDLYVGTGKPDLRALYPNRMFMGVSGNAFRDVTTAGGFGHLQKGHAIVFADMDADGDQDIYAQMGGAVETDYFQNALFENPGFGNSWLTLRVEGRESNRDAIGTRVKVEYGADGTVNTVYDWVGPGGSFGGGSLQTEMGLGNADTVMAIEMYWPKTGETQRLEGLSVNQIVKIVEGESGYTTVNQPAFQFGGDAIETEGPEAQGHHDHTGHSH